MPTVGQTFHSVNLVKIFPIGTWVFRDVIRLTVGINHHTGISSECCRDTEVGVTFWGVSGSSSWELPLEDDMGGRGGLLGKRTCMSHGS